MTQRELHRQLACATGETVRDLRRRGFGLLDLTSQSIDEHEPRAPQIFDWDALEAERERASLAPGHFGPRHHGLQTA